MDYIGITPAHAGKSNYIKAIRRQRKDHPRPCGEKKVVAYPSTMYCGSPPPMRGKGAQLVASSIRPRITPAHAGKSCWTKLIMNTYGDHPRPCGEKPKALRSVRMRSGSPPPMRGKAVNPLIAILAPGITPAHAGKRC